MQPYPHRSDKWEKYYSLRNTVEASYSHIKDSMAEDLGNPEKRQKRGDAFAFVAMALAASSANIRRIIAFLTQLGSANPVTSKNRKSYSRPSTPSYSSRPNWSRPCTNSRPPGSTQHPNAYNTDSNNPAQKAGLFPFADLSTLKQVLRANSGGNNSPETRTADPVFTGSAVPSSKAELDGFKS